MFTVLGILLACIHVAVIVFAIAGFFLFREEKGNPLLFSMHRPFVFCAVLAGPLLGRCPLTTLQEALIQQDDPEFTMENEFVGGMFEAFDVAWLPPTANFCIGVVSFALGMYVMYESLSGLRRESQKREFQDTDPDP